MSLLDWIIIGVVAVVVLIAALVFIIKVAKLPREKKLELLKTFLKGAVAFAEKEIGSGHGADKLKMVEDYFYKNAGFFLKAILILTGKDDLTALIEQGLKEIKESFDKSLTA